MGVYFWPGSGGEPDGDVYVMSEVSAKLLARRMTVGVSRRRFQLLDRQVPNMYEYYLNLTVDIAAVRAEVKRCLQVCGMAILTAFGRRGQST